MHTSTLYRMSLNLLSCWYSYLGYFDKSFWLAIFDRGGSVTLTDLATLGVTVSAWKDFEILVLQYQQMKSISASSCSRNMLHCVASFSQSRLHPPLDSISYLCAITPVLQESQIITESACEEEAGRKRETQHWSTALSCWT